MSDALLAQLAREPVAGRVKTRLLPALSPDAAALLHSDMVRCVCEILCDSGLGRVQLWVDGDPSSAPFRALAEKGLAAVHVQQGRDLGERMLHIAARGFADGYRRVVLVGSDAPSLSTAYLAQALAGLERSDVVFGPALDGGYVLLGLRRPVNALFRDMPWGSDRVLTSSRERCRAAGVSYVLLDPLPDIDRPEDLVYLPDALAARLPSTVGLRRK